MITSKNTPTLLQKNIRNPNFELLRIISIIMIIGLHLFGHGGILDAFGSKHYPLWSIEACISVSVNCYVFISGYFLVTSKFKLRKLFMLYLQVLFYSVVIYVILLTLGIVQFNKIRLVQELLPILSRRYWFVTCYVAMYILSPFLNKLIMQLTKKQMQIFIIILLFLFCEWNVLITFLSTLNTDHGYGVGWFICLYFLAAYIRLHYDKKINKYFYLLFYFAICFITAALKTGLGLAGLFRYSSITILFASLSLFLFFRELDIKNKFANKVIFTLAPLSLGVYLIHDNKLIRSILYTDILHLDKYMTSVNIYLLIILCLLIIFTAAIIIEYIRKNILMKPIENSIKINTFFNSLQNRILTKK
jgi:surface polysaccharide O-acyltransferase-like enzyme